jgi:hypothetical protein
VKATVTSTEAALLLRMDPRSFPRWARALGVEPVRRQRIGRSTVTVWSLAELGGAASRAETARDDGSAPT